MKSLFVSICVHIRPHHAIKRMKKTHNKMYKNISAWLFDFRSNVQTHINRFVLIDNMFPIPPDRTAYLRLPIIYSEYLCQTE